MNILLTIVGLIGITIIITSGAIFDSLRKVISEKSESSGRLINCPMCTGFWIGLIVGFVGMPIDISPIILAGIVAVLSWSTYTVVDYFATKSVWYAIKTVRHSEKSSSSKPDDVGEKDES